MMRIAMLGMMLAACVYGMVACSGPSESEIALEVAQEWTITSIDQATGAVVDLLIDEHPWVAQIATVVVADQIRSNLSWTYGTPVQEGSDRYSVRVTAGADIKVAVPFLDDKAYSVSAPFDLMVNTETRTVVNWSPDPLSVRIEEQ